MNLLNIDTQIKMPGMVLPVRTTVYSTEDSKVIFSPGSRISVEEYKNIGRVTDLVVTNLFHAAGIKNALMAFPEARVWIPEGAESLNGLENAKNISIIGKSPWPYENEIAVFPLGGMPKVREIIFYFKREKAIYVTDLFFNLVAPKGLGSFIILKLFGTYKKFGLSRFMNRLIADKKAFQKSIEQLLKLEIQELIPCHGEILTQDVTKKMHLALAERGYHFPY